MEIVKTQGILFARVVNYLILMIKDIVLRFLPRKFPFKIGCSEYIDRDQQNEIMKDSTCLVEFCKALFWCSMNKQPSGKHL